MKILFVIDTLGPGGKERRLTELLKVLKDSEDFNIELAVMSNDIHYKEVLDLGINITRIIRKTKRDLSVFVRFYKFIKYCRPDLVHCWDSMTAVYVTPVCKLLRCKIINGMVIDAPLNQNILNKHWLRARLTFPFSDVIVANSKAGLAAYRAPVNKGVIIRNGFNFKRTENLIGENTIKEQLELKSAFVVGMIATFSEKKDYPTYFNAAQLILSKRRDVTFLAIGAGTDSNEAYVLINKENVDFFRLLGERTGVESIINVMDICVLSTFSEGISNSILEYMAFGKPVVATRGGGTEEIVDDRVTGFLINRSNPEELAGKIELLLNDPDLGRRMGAGGKQKIENEFSIDQMMQGYVNMYTGLITN